MCGIAGWVDTRRYLKDQGKVVARMAETLGQRGPDDTGLYLSNHALLGHRRLTVVDPEGGPQPMTRTHLGRDYTIVYNGELYNTEEIRKLLKEAGYSFQGYSDTEVLLTSFIHWSVDCLKYLNGIFAFALWDQEERKLFMARDPLGVKPLFFTRRGSSLLFASEIKALLAHPQVSPVLDERGIMELFGLGPARSPGSGILKGIEELPPAWAALYYQGQFKSWEYWRLQAAPHLDSEEETVARVRELLVDAITRQLVADVPVVTFLSGGLDSSAISAVAAQEFRKQGKTLHTWSIDYRDNAKFFQESLFQPDPDSAWTGLMSDYLGSQHQNVLIGPRQLADALDQAVLANDLPGMADIDSSLWLFCQEVRKEATVALSGECADEIFAGYPWYWRLEFYKVKNFPWSIALPMRRDIIAERFSRLPLEEYVQSKYQSSLEEVSHLEGEAPEQRRHRELFQLNLKWFMVTLLNRKDRMSMANSLEVRVPFADYRIVEYAYNIPRAMMLMDGREKGLLRRALGGILPERVIQRRKSPYPKTHHPGYLDLVHRRLAKIIQDKNAPLHQLINSNHASGLLASKGQSVTTPWFGQLMMGPQLIAWLTQLDFWLRKYGVDIDL